MICYSDRTRIKTGLELLTATKEIEKRLDEVSFISPHPCALIALELEINLHVLQVSSPLLILHGLADKVTDPSVSRFLYEKASSMDKTLKLYKEGYHCILEGEPDDRIYTVLGDIISWLDARC